VRRQLAYYVARHGFEIGDYSFGAPTVLFFKDEGRLKIGKYCSIAAGATFVLGGNHRTDTVTTFPLGRMTGNYRPEEMPRSRGDIVLGSDVWVAANAVILSGVTIGDGAVIGAGSVVIHDIPPYAMVFGNPARVMSKRFPDEIVNALLELRWWDLDDKEVQLLRPFLQSTDIAAFIDACSKLRGLPQQRVPAAVPRLQRLSASEVSSTASTPGMTSEEAAAAKVVAVIQHECPGFSVADLDKPFEEIGIDSFGMLIVRTQVEEALQRTIDDATWGLVSTPADMVRALAAVSLPHGRSGASEAAVERRQYELNMPQMALGGLSESWLFKEFGDIHWSMITKGLGAQSRTLQDGSGDRLYATFTRFRFDSTSALAAYAENERIVVDAQISRYGAGLFFSEVVASGDHKSVRARLMSSFSKIGETGSNTSLLKGQPQIPPDCNIPTLANLPAFGLEYRARRTEELAAPIFECEYEILPSHDINGVGLLYFAAYPMINDICAARHGGRLLATGFSTRQRDVFYFSNSDPDETLIYRLHRWVAGDDRIEMEASISRKSDGVLMAYIMTEKDACGGSAATRNGTQ
jgi:probable biosynthetic protein (TIGR04098 family)